MCTRLHMSVVGCAHSTHPLPRMLRSYKQSAERTYVPCQPRLQRRRRRLWARPLPPRPPVTRSWPSWPSSSQRQLLSSPWPSTQQQPEASTGDGSTVSTQAFPTSRVGQARGMSGVVDPSRPGVDTCHAPNKRGSDRGMVCAEASQELQDLLPTYGGTWVTH